MTQIVWEGELSRLVRYRNSQYVINVYVDPSFYSCFLYPTACINIHFLVVQGLAKPTMT